MPPQFRLLDADIWIPLTITPATNVMGVGNVRPAHFRILGHLKDGVSLAAAEYDLAPIFQQYQTRHPGDYPEKIVLRAKNFIDSVVGELRGTLVSLMCAVLLLLLIACCNVANLLLARATVREKEDCDSGSHRCDAGSFNQREPTDSESTTHKSMVSTVSPAFS